MRSDFKNNQNGQDQNQNDLPEKLSNPAKRALVAAGIFSLEQLTHYKESEIKRLHGIGPNAMVMLEKSMRESNLTFSTE